MWLNGLNGSPWAPAFRPHRKSKSSAPRSFLLSTPYHLHPRYCPPVSYMSPFFVNSAPKDPSKPLSHCHLQRHGTTITSDRQSQASAHTPLMAHSIHDWRPRNVTTTVRSLPGNEALTHRLTALSLGLVAALGIMVMECLTSCMKTHFVLNRGCSPAAKADFGAT